MNPICPYCGMQSMLVDGTSVYSHRLDLAHKWFYKCFPCDAYVGCHPGTKKPLGRLANAELRRLKSSAHAAFDPLWKDGLMRRGEAYSWLSQKLGIRIGDCHIGMMDEDLCRKVVEACRIRCDLCD